LPIARKNGVIAIIFDQTRLVDRDRLMGDLFNLIVVFLGAKSPRLGRTIILHEFTGIIDHQAVDDADHIANCIVGSDHAG